MTAPDQRELKAPTREEVLAMAERLNKATARLHLRPTEVGPAAYDAATMLRALATEPEAHSADPAGGEVGERERIAAAIANRSLKVFATWAENHSTYPNCYKGSVDDVYAKADRVLAALQPSAADAGGEIAGVREAVPTDTQLIDMLRDECWDLRCFSVPTGGDDADVAWRVIGHWQAEPHERTISERYSDDPRAALCAALDGSRTHD